MARNALPFVLVLAGSVASAAAACSTKSNIAGLAPSPSGSAMIPPFEPSTPEVYVRKVKNLLVGLPPTDDEVTAVKADPSALGGLVDGWMTTPEYQQKMLAFFATAFQQSQVVSADFVTQLPNVNNQLGNNAAVVARLLYALRTSYAFTVWQLVLEGRPFSETMTTSRFMMNPPLMALYAFLDEHHVDDASKIIDRTIEKNPGFTYSVTAKGPIAIAETLDPKSPSYMHWALPDLGKKSDLPGCADDPRVYSKQTVALYQILMGGLQQLTLADGTKCPGAASASLTGQFDDGDFGNWRMVTVRPPNAGEDVTAFYDIPTLQKATELVLRIPRTGFFTTPSFLAQWNTNVSNSARVTINQTLVVGLGGIFDGSHPTMPADATSIDLAHAGAAECISCHRTLDPMRQYFRQAFTVNFHEQTDGAMVQVPGVFAFGGVSSVGTGIGDLGAQMAAHPDFAAAWAQKLCYYANSVACAPDDPEFLRIVKHFQDSQLSWSVLVRDIFSSPLTTRASDTKTADAAAAKGLDVVPISRREHWCAALGARLGLGDPCVLASAPLGATQQTIQAIAVDLPTDGYGRGSPVPVLANDPNLFFRASVENLCRLIAAEVVDAPGGKSRYASSDAAGAIADMVSNVMALTTTDPRAAGATMILSEHMQAAMTQGASATDALKSTFVLACTSPSSVGLGL